MTTTIGLHIMHDEISRRVRPIAVVDRSGRVIP